MNAKKLLALLLALIVCTGTLAACDTKPAETTAGTSAPVQSTTAPTGTAAPTETTEAAPLTNAERYPIDFDGTLTCVSTRQNAAETAYWLAWEEHTGVDVDWQAAAIEQVPLLFLDEKTMPDMFFQASGLSVPQINEYGQQGRLINYMDYLDKLPNIAARYAEDPMLFDSVKDAEGNVYTLPYYCDTLTMPSNLFYVRLDQAREAGWETMPTTVEDFLTFCEDLKTTFAKWKGMFP